MKTVAVDFETHLIKPGCISPRLVCASYYDGVVSKLCDHDQSLVLMRGLLEDNETVIVNQHIFYDLGVLVAEDFSFMPLIFAAIDEGRIHCTKIRQMMIDNASGHLKFIENEEGDLKPQDYSLQALAWRYFKKHISKGADTWRLRYNQLDGIPIEQWPADAVSYPLQDAELALRVYEEQEKLVVPEGIPGETSQTQAAWALQLMSMWGLRTDHDRVVALEAALQAEYAQIKERLIACGLVRKIGTRDMAKIREIVVEAWEKTRSDEVIPKTDGGAVSTDRDTLVKSGDERLKDVANYVRVGKVLTTYVPMLKRGVEIPINCSYNTILETYRTSCSRPNIQQPPRKGGVRECFVPRNGWVYIGADYDTLEMRTLAQTCLDLFGYSQLAEVLKAGQDPHLALAADLLGIDYQEAETRYKAGDKELENARQAAKPGNFGLPGGMAAPTLREYARASYGIEISAEKAYELHSGFRKKFPEMVDYFNHAKALVGGDVAARVIFPRSGMVRGHVPYTAVCNGYFQHLAACGAKGALYAVTRECYIDEKSALYGSRPVIFLHDEIICESPEDRSSAAAARLQQLMCEVMQTWIPDIPAKATAVITRRWFKGAKPVKVDGRLVPSKPHKDEKGAVTWVADLG